MGGGGDGDGGVAVVVGGGGGGGGAVEGGGEELREAGLERGELTRFDPPQSWKCKLELAAALKVVYAMFAGERRVKNFLGTGKKPASSCCLL